MAGRAMNEVTCWTLLRGAAAGDRADREEFARRYLPVARAYLTARWRQRLNEDELEDALQEVFVECLRDDGVLERLQGGAREGFRAVLYGVVRNVALRVETAAARTNARRARDLPLEDVQADDPSLSRVFDRAWAVAIVREAASRLKARARAGDDPEARRRVELLELRFQAGLPIRTIAERWGVDAARLHHDYARARREFEAELRELVAFHNPAGTADRRMECLQVLSQIE